MHERSVISSFIRLRWLAFVGQVILLTTVITVVKLTIPWVQIGIVLLLIPVTNLLFQYKMLPQFSEKKIVGSILALDTLILTFTLHFAGGPTNPFTIVYLLHVVLAAVMLTPRWTWAIAILSSIGFGTLFVNFHPVPEWENHGAHHGFSLHLHGMLFAYVTVALLVTYFLNKIVSELRKKERTLERLQNKAINQQRLASLTTITAGAAHELGTPLATIAVVAHELERTVAKKYYDKDLLEDIMLLKEETIRCKNILQQLSEKTGDLLGESPQPAKVSELVNNAVGPLKLQTTPNLYGDMELLMPKVPVKSLTLAIRAIIKNAYEASLTTKHPVEIVASNTGREMILDIKDQGLGMDGEMLERVGEPFFSKKESGHGMGLGVYLSKLTVEQLGGNLTISSAPGQGTKVRLSFPIDCSTLKEAA